MSTIPFSIICASHDKTVLEENLLASPCIQGGNCDCIVQQGFANIPQAYNEAAKQAHNDLLCFVHHDVTLPEGWETRLLEQVARMEEIDPDWAVLGCAGAVLRDGEKRWLGHLYDRCHVFGQPEGLPAEVDTLDELLLVCRKKDARFDEGMPNYHLFGAELCLRMRKQGRKCYAIDAYCNHNSGNWSLKADFAVGAGYLYAKYADMLPIATTCATIHRQDGICVFSL